LIAWMQELSLAAPALVIRCAKDNSPALNRPSSGGCVKPG
jgi:hypothetical protein